MSKGRRVKLSDLPQNIRDQIASASANSKQYPCNALEATQKVERFVRPINLRYHEKRKRLTDSDGQFTKYFTDAIVSAGILRSDDPSVIPQSPKKTQEKSDQQETVITIVEL